MPIILILVIMVVTMFYWRFKFLTHSIANVTWTRKAKIESRSVVLIVFGIVFIAFGAFSLLRGINTAYSPDRFVSGGIALVVVGIADCFWDIKSKQ